MCKQAYYILLSLRSFFTTYDMVILDCLSHISWLCCIMRRRTENNSISSLPRFSRWTQNDFEIVIQLSLFQYTKEEGLCDFYRNCSIWPIFHLLYWIDLKIRYFDRKISDKLLLFRWTSNPLLSVFCFCHEKLAVNCVDMWHIRSYIVLFCFIFRESEQCLVKIQLDWA